MDTLLYKENIISVTRHFLKKNILLVDLSAVGVECWAEVFLRINLSSYFHATYFSGIL